MLKILKSNFSKLSAMVAFVGIAGVLAACDLKSNESAVGKVISRELEQHAPADWVGFGQSTESCFAVVEVEGKTVKLPAYSLNTASGADARVNTFLPKKYYLKRVGTAWKPTEVYLLVTDVPKEEVQAKVRACIDILKSHREERINEALRESREEAQRLEQQKVNAATYR